MGPVGQISWNVCLFQVIVFFFSAFYHCKFSMFFLYHLFGKYGLSTFLPTCSNCFQLFANLLGKLGRL